MWMRESKKIFFEGVKAFYRAVVVTMLTKFSFKDELVDDAVILLPENQSKVTVSIAFRLAYRFSVVVPEDKFDAPEAEIWIILRHLRLKCHQCLEIKENLQTVLKYVSTGRK